MDTILKPRYLCSTTTDESSSEEDEDNDSVHCNKKDSTCSSKITVIPNCASIVQVEMLEKEGNKEDDDDEPEASSGSRIVYPTARFLQVNPKKVSSFDLLVHPPKRPRFINHPSREHIAHAAAFKQKTKPVLPPMPPKSSGGQRKKSPVLESIYFENEKLRYRQTMSGNWSSASSSASPRNQTNAQSQCPKPMKSDQQPEQITSLYVNPDSLPQKLSEEETLRDFELADAYQRTVYTDGDGGADEHMEEYTAFVQAENFVEENQDASSIFRTCYEDLSSTFDGHVILDEKTGEFRVIHHPDLRELQSESITVVDGDSFLDNMADENGNIADFQEDDKEDQEDYDLEFIEERPISALLPTDSFNHLNENRSSPLAIFLAGLTDDMMGSGVDLGQVKDFHDLRFEMGSPFSNFGTECGDSGEGDGRDKGLEDSRIEDVTDIMGDDEQVDSVIHLVRSGEAGEGSSEMKTIFWANSAPGSSNKAGKMDRVTSEPCQLIDGFKDKRKGKRTTTSELNDGSQNSLDFQEEIDAQEFLLQPKPKLNLSSSVHSAFERGNVQRTSTVARFVEKKTKSDYFVGKIKGASKTYLKQELISENSNIQIKSELEFSEDSKIDITGNDDTQTDSEGHRSEETPRHHQQKLHKSSSALTIAVVNAKRKVSSGNRVSNAIPVPDKTQKKKGMPPPPLRNQTATITSTRRGEVQQLRFPRPLRRSSSSSSHQQILMTIKAKSPTYAYKKTAKSSANQKQHKSILKKDRKPNFFMRIFGRLFGISTTTEKSKQSRSRSKMIDNLTPSVPSSILKRSDRGIVHHTDSKELYRERRRNFFNEQKEFCDESLATYLEGMLSHENSSGAQDFVTIPPRIPLNYFLQRAVMFPREAVKDTFNDNTANSSKSSDKNNNKPSSCPVPIPVRLAKSENALTSTSSGGQGGRLTSIARANLVLQFPPFVQVLAAGMARRRRSSLENKSDFKRVKDELKKPIKGILKNPQT